MKIPCPDCRRLRQYLEAARQEICELELRLDGVAQRSRQAAKNANAVTRVTEGEAAATDHGH